MWANGVLQGTIGNGLVAFTGVAKGDTRDDADYLAAKLTGLRVFEDDSGKMNRSVLERQGGIILVSNFTLYAATGKGKRPSFDRAAPPDEARPIYEYFVDQVRASGLAVVSGVFQANMRVLVDNDGPVTLICDSPT